MHTTESNPSMNFLTDDLRLSKRVGSWVGARLSAYAMSNAVTLHDAGVIPSVGVSTRR